MKKVTTKIAASGVWLFILFLILGSPIVAAQDNGCSIYAGGGQTKKIDGLAAKAGFNNPYGLAVDSKGNLYIADCYNNAIRVIANGVVSTVAGGGELLDSYGFLKGGYVDGKAADARFNRPRAVAVDNQGTIYVADSGNHVIRKIVDGQVTTFAGTGQAGYLDGNKSQACFNTPSGLTLDEQGNLYIADTLNNVIRKVTPSGAVSTYAGVKSGKAGFLDGNLSEAMFNEPADLTIDSAGNLYVADSGNQLIRKIGKGSVETLAGTRGALINGTDYYQGSYLNGHASKAAFNFPKGLIVLENGTVLVADTWNSRVRAILPSGQVITLVGTGQHGLFEGTVDEAVLGSPVGIAAYMNKLYIADADNNRIWQLDINQAKLQARPDYAEPTERIQVWLNGEKLEFTEDSQPYILQGRTMLPLRALCEKLGYTVEWFPDGTIVVEKEGWQLEFAAGDPNLQIKNGRTMMGLRYFGEKIGCRVEWVPAYRDVSVLAR